MGKNKRTKILRNLMAFILVLAMITGCGYRLTFLITGYESNAVYAASTAEEDNTAYEELEKMHDVIEFITNNYKTPVSASQLIKAAYTGIFNSLDNWSEYYSTSEEENAFTSLLNEEEYCGIGITIQEKADGIYIIDINMKGPAKKAGLKVGDKILSVNNKSMLGKTADDVSKACRGKEGTKRKIKVLRGSEELSFNLFCEKLSVCNVSGHMLNENTAYVKIDIFTRGVADDFRNIRDELITEGAKNLILDLRDNGGGFLDEAENIASFFLPKDAKITEFYRQNKNLETDISDGVGYAEMNTVILINENSASASECVAAALKYNNKAKLVGLTSYGKGCAQSIYQVGDNTSFKLSVFYFTGPNGEAIDGKGIVPDYVVYNGPVLGSSTIEELTKYFVPMTEGKKYVNPGSQGMNVLAAQQRLKLMGFDVDTNATLDEKTMTALKQIQKDAGGYPYGALDFFTIKALENRYQALISGSGADLQLEKALDILK